MDTDGVSSGNALAMPAAASSAAAASEIGERPHRDRCGVCGNGDGLNRMAEAGTRRWSTRSGSSPASVRTKTSVSGTRGAGPNAARIGAVCAAT